MHRKMHGVCGVSGVRAGAWGENIGSADHLDSPMYVVTMTSAGVYYTLLAGRGSQSSNPAGRGSTGTRIVI